MKFQNDLISSFSSQSSDDSCDHFAIVETLTLSNFEATPESIAQRLRLPVNTVKAALFRLESVNLVTRINGQWQSAYDNYLIEDIPSQAIREHHQQILTKAKEALNIQNISSREYSSTALALDPKIIPEIKEKIRIFRREIEELASQSKSKTAVYEIAIQAFRLDFPE